MNVHPCIEHAAYYAQLWFWLCFLCSALFLKFVWKLRWGDVWRELIGFRASQLPLYVKEILAVVTLGGAGGIFLYLHSQCL